MALIVGGTTVTGTQTLEASTLTGTAAAINGSNITNLPAPSTANVGTATAGLAVLDVGSYGFGNQVTGSGNGIRTQLGQTISGGNIKASNAAGSNFGPTLGSGTWRAMGEGAFTTTNTELQTIVWLRIS
jgi:hypothetical protein|tara:strand:- start:305 stop:691 length:387 start_codon:yes stop_codon:yes gene_type:complete